MNKKYALLILLFSTLSTSETVYSRIIYVKANAKGLNKGTSWKDAYTDFVQASKTALEGDTIEIAKGSYYLTAVVNLPIGVVLGGYSSNDSTAPRNFAINETIISALNGNSQLAHVFRADDYGSSHCLVDGIIIEKALTYSENGAGVYIYRSTNITFQNCIFRNNYADHSGGAVYVTGTGSVKLINCFFLNNESNNGTVGCAQASTCTLQNCVFADNYSNAYGAAIYCEQSTITVTNNTIFRNSSYGNNVNADVVHVINGGNVAINNSIFFASKLNTGNTDSQESFADETSTLTVNNCMTENYSSGQKLSVSQNPKFTDTSNLAGSDGHFFTSDDGLALLNPGSIAINGGKNHYSSGIPKDITGKKRVFNSTVDLGAYELQQKKKPQPKVLYVNRLAKGANDGTSWKDAFTDLQKALSYTSDTIKVAAGKYYPSKNDPGLSFWPENKRVILGGYPNTGNPTDKMRDPKSYPAILDGSLPNGQHAHVIVRCRSVNSTSVLDGFTITGCASADYYANPVTAIYTTGSSCLLRNCTIRNNSSGSGAGSVNGMGSKVKYLNCIFSKNTSYDGGALLNKNSAPMFINCTFSNNTTPIDISFEEYYGGVMVNDFANPYFDSCSFKSNTCNLQGGVAYNKNGSSPSYNNSFFLGNSTVYGNASDFYNENSGAAFYNCVIDDSAYTKNKYGTSSYNVNSTEKFEKCSFKNCRGGYFGGGVAHNSAGASVLFNSCLFNANQALSAGAVIYNESYSHCTLLNCVGINNSGYDASILTAADDSYLTVTNCTFANNLGRQLGAPVIKVPNTSANISIINSVFWNNDLEGHQDIEGTGASLIVFKNNLTEVFKGTGQSGIISNTNPNFKNISDPDGKDNKFFTSDDGLELSKLSPAINKGLNSAAHKITVDVTGNPRIYGNKVDMGAYEFQSSGLMQETPFEYSNAIQIDKADAAGVLNIFPNPVQTVLNVQFGTSNTGDVILTIADASGSVVQHKIFAGNGNKLSTSINIRDLSNGVYYLTIEQNGKKQKTSFIKM